MQHPPNTGNLAGKRIFISRPATDARHFSEPVIAAGACVLAAPLIETAPLPFEPPPADAYDWIFITSRNGAAAGLPLLDRSKPVAAVGPASAEAVEAAGFRVTFLSQTHHAAAAAQAFLEHFGEQPLRLLWPCGNLADPEPARILQDAGMTVLSPVVYETRPVDTVPAEIEAVLREGVDILALTSPSSVASFHHRGYPVAGATVVCIGPATAAAARTLLGRCDREAPVHTLAGLADVLLEPDCPS